MIFMFILHSACSECYRLIQIEVHELRRQIQNATNSLNSVRGISELSQNTSFATRLTALTNSVSLLTANARNSSTIESGLAAELATLNISFDAMQRTLSQNVSKGINDTESNMRVINGTRNQITRLQTEIYQLVWASYYVLQRDVIGKVNITRESRNDLSNTDRNMSLLWSQYNIQYVRTGAGLNQTLSLAADAARTSQTIASLHNETSSILNASELLLQQHRNALATLRASMTYIQSNLSVILNNVTQLSRQANQALRNASSLNATPDQSFVQLRNRYDNFQRNLTLLNRTLSTLDGNYNTLLQNLTAYKANSVSFERSLNQSEVELRSLATQARNAEVSAGTAINSANRVQREAEEMLRIMQNFNTTSRNAETMAQLSLRRTNEVCIGEIRFVN